MKNLFFSHQTTRDPGWHGDVVGWDDESNTRMTTPPHSSSPRIHHEADEETGRRGLVVFVCVFVWMGVFVCMGVFVRMGVFVCMCVFVWMGVFVCMSVFVCMCVFVCVCVYECVYVCLCVLRV